MFVIEGSKEWHVIDAPEVVDFFSTDKPMRHYHGIVRKGELICVSLTAMLS